MKRILDSTFRYRPSFATDVKKTFARARRQQRSSRAPAREIKVIALGSVKKAGR